MTVHQTKVFNTYPRAGRTNGQFRDLSENAEAGRRLGPLMAGGLGIRAYTLVVLPTTSDYASPCLILNFIRRALRESR